MMVATINLDKPATADFFFTDAQYSFQALRAVAAADGQAADIGECLVAIRSTKEGDDESWYAAWSNLAKRMEEHAQRSQQQQHNESAKTAFLRASNYYRTAEFFLHADPKDPRLLATWKKSRECFRAAAKLSENPIEEVRIPFENSYLPGYFCFASTDKTAKKPLIIIQTGFDGTAEELYYQIGHAAAARGYNCLLFEGPGQGQVIREQHIPFRPNWETVITPVIDFALQQKQVDKDRIALMGISFGGYLVPRALAFEHRVKIGIANGGVYDFHEVCMRHEPPELDKQMDDPQIAKEIDQYILKEMKASPSLRWAVGNGMFTFQASTPTDWLKLTRAYQLKDVVKNIRANMLVIDSEHDIDMPGQSKKLFDALQSPKEFMFFTNKEGAGEHCQIGAYAFSNERVFNWLDDNL